MIETLKNTSTGESVLWKPTKRGLGSGSIAGTRIWKSIVIEFKFAVLSARKKVPISRFKLRFLSLSFPLDDDAYGSLFDLIVET